MLVIDMVKDNFDERKQLPITPFAKAIVDPLNQLIGLFRNHDWPIVFATDAYRAEDFIFKGAMKPHSLAGTSGAEVVETLHRRETDCWLPKRRFSAFFATNLHEWLKARGVTVCAVGGIATNYCVLSTALDALCHDFKVVLLEDCSAATSAEIHRKTLDLYRRNPIYPLFRVLPSQAFVKEMNGGSEE